MRSRMLACLVPCTLKKAMVCALLVYGVVTCFTAYMIINNGQKKRDEKQLLDTTNQLPELSEEDEQWNPWGEEFEKEVVKPLAHKRPLRWESNKTLDFGKNFDSKSKASSGHTVEIWSKTGIGTYLWMHILGGKLESKMASIWSYGFRKIGNLKFKFRTGRGVIPSKAPTDTEQLVLVLSGRAPDIIYSKLWLDFLGRLHRLKHVTLMMLGDEKCDNDWLWPYMAWNGGHVNATFIVYDAPQVDGRRVFQWPLGVATYRGFPNVAFEKLNIERPRKYACSFAGTVYPNTTRQKLVQVMRTNQVLKEACHVSARQKWERVESVGPGGSLDKYLQLLLDTDLTICPAGQNSETYRAYEALSFGSIPILDATLQVERLDTATAKCSGNASLFGTWVPAPHRVFKSLKAPVIFVRDWERELPDIVRRERGMREEERVRRRMAVLEWYQFFKAALRKHFVDVVSAGVSLDS